MVLIIMAETGKLFPDLYIEENKRFDSLITIVKLMDAEVIDEEMDTVNFYGVYLSGKGYFEIELHKQGELRFDYIIERSGGKSSIHGSTNIELLFERIENFIIRI